MRQAEGVYKGEGQRSGANPGERFCALVLLLVAAPLIALIAVLIRITAGPPAFHRGLRMGRGRRTFTMLKLRTLRLGADKLTGAELLGSREELTIAGGRFLRDTRLDELPQLLNIVRGEMSFVGPRPERPDVFEAKCANIAGYERRFSVRPGLIGVSQLFTPHGTPKRYRTLIDNGVLRRESRGMRRLRIVTYTVWAVLCEVTRRSVRQLVVLRARLAGRYREKRRLRRVTPVGAVAHLVGGSGAVGRSSSRVIDMNAETILLEGSFEAQADRKTEFVLAIPVRGRTRPARRSARCVGRVLERRAGEAGQRFLIQYKASSERSEYMIQQYFLGGSLAKPPRNRRPAALAPESDRPLPAEAAPVEFAPAQVAERDLLAGNGSAWPTTAHLSLDEPEAVRPASGRQPIHQP